jgi:large subunit ribosomal protein L13
MKTYSPKASELRPGWRVIDADGQILGRLASQIAQILKGKLNPAYVPHMLSGDFVVVVNAGKIAVTGNKLENKFYHRHSGYPGGYKRTQLSKAVDTNPTRVIEHAVKGMLPHNSLGRDMLRRLKVYGGPTHPHTAQLAAQAQAEK